MKNRVLIVALSILLTFFIGAPVKAKNHETVIEGAKKVGSLVLYTSMTVDQAQKLNDAFRVKHPLLQVQMFRNIFGAPKP